MLIRRPFIIGCLLLPLLTIAFEGAAASIRILYVPLYLYTPRVIIIVRQMIRE